MRLTRRNFLRLSFVSLLSACSARADPTAILPPAPTFTPTLSPTATVAPTATATLTPSPTSSPTTEPPNTPTSQPPTYAIQHVVIFIQENHSFDSMFAGFAGADGVAHGGVCSDQQRDPNHSHAAALMPNGVADPWGDCHYTGSQIPNYWKVARAFTLCDRYFTEVRGPSAPNYFMLTSAQSPIIDSPTREVIVDVPALPHRLMEKGLTWREYGGVLNAYRSLHGRPEIVSNQSRIIADAQAGTLANVSWLISGFDVSGHPPASLCAAENWMVRVLSALMRGPQWGATAVFLSWDDWGGFYDHIVPPVLERWRDGTPFRLGQRVPCTVVSPFAKAGYVSQRQHSHISLLKFVETVFDLKPLTAREAQVDDMLDCFDFAQPPLAPLALQERKCG